MECPKCKYVRPQSDNSPSEVCPSCGIIYSKYDASLEAKKETYRHRTVQKNLPPVVQPGSIKQHSFTTIIVACIVTFALAWAWGSRTEKDDPDRSQEQKRVPDAFDAKYACKQYVEEALKSPSSADFPSYSEMSATGSAYGPWTVISYVDAKNAFGVMLRNTFICTVEMQDGKVKLLNLSIE